MFKTRKIKRNWGQEDLKILIWVISKYCDLKEYVDLEKDIVRLMLFRPTKTGEQSLPSFQVSPPKHACSSGSA
jgi:hypothetical protein